MLFGATGANFPKISPKYPQDEGDGILEPCMSMLPYYTQASSDSHAHWAAISNTLQLIQGSQLDVESPDGQQLIATSIDRALYLMSLVEGSLSTEQALSNYFCKSALIDELRQATCHDQLQLYYQPIFQLQTNPVPANPIPANPVQQEQIIGVEALLRWDHPTIGSIGPREFLPMIEATDYIHELGAWVLRQACLQVHEWHQQGWGSLQLNVNLSVRQLEQTHVLDQVLTILAETGLRADFLTLELTDTEIPHTCQTIQQLLGQLRQQGIRVRLDDVGADSFALQDLSDLPLDGFKVDRLLVSQRHWQRLTKIMMQAEQRGLTVVVAGIETLEQLEHLRGLGCTLGQGYLLSPPLQSRDMERLLQTQLLQL